MYYRKKLIEVALPLDAINAASAREKSIRHGHPSTLHLWWARRPLAACRAVLFASLVDDPDSDPTCRKADGTVDEGRAVNRRAELFELIEELVEWKNSDNESVLSRARAEIAASVASRKILDAKEWTKDQIISNEKAWTFVCRTARPENVNAFLGEHAPPVLDPFCGGGSIPLEAQRLGLRAYGSDLNPVPVLITKALIEIPQKFANMPPVNSKSRGEAGPAGKKGKGRGKSIIGQSEWRGSQGLAEDVRYYGNWMRDEAEKRVGLLYPKMRVTAEMTEHRPDLNPHVGDEFTVIAWLWARTVASPNPSARGAHIPLVSSFMLSTKLRRKSWVEVHPDATSEYGWQFHVRSGDLSAEAERRAKSGTRAGKAKDFICALTETPVARTYIQSEGKAGRLGVRLMAIVGEGSRGRIYFSPDQHSESVAASADGWQVVESSRRSFLSGATPTRAMITGGVCSAYGLSTWGHLFTARQLVSLTTFSDLIGEVRERVRHDAEKAPWASDGLSRDGGSPTAGAYGDAIGTYLTFAIDRALDRTTTLCTWDSSPKMEALRSTFARQALPMTWDFAEGNPFSESSGNWAKNLDWVATAVAALPCAARGYASQSDATSSIGNVKGAVVSTDPPYYDNISYAELSDFFYVWLRRSLATVYPSLFSTVLTPKKQELIASAFRHEGNGSDAKAFFEGGLEEAFSRMREAQTPDCPLTVYYAFKQTETDEGEEENNQLLTTASTGWETMLSGLLRAGFSVEGTWPIRTELANKIGMSSNMLASSIVLSCRSRSPDAPLATRREFLTSLKRELPHSLRHMQRSNIAPVDLAQAAIGPGMAVFTRYTKVMEADGSPMKVRQALALINQTLDEVLAEQEGEFDGDTRWALAWFEQFGMDDGAFGVAETLSKAKNTAVNALVEAGLIAARGGKVRLLKRDELPKDWNPATDKRITTWEITQYLILALETHGEIASADLLRKVGGMGEVARDLAYRLFNLCERKWPSEAQAYNGLVIAWPEIAKLAQSAAPATADSQAEMF